MGRVLSRIAPGATVPVEDVRPYVTHDEKEFERMRKDERDGIQATSLSARMGNEFIKAQEWVPGHIDGWKYQMLAIVPGDDRVEDSETTLQLLSRIGKDLVAVHQYPGNYHECFNEINRKEVLDRMMLWCESRLR